MAEREHIPARVSKWLMKSEPGTFSIDDLKKQKTTRWDGVRNYQARNFMQAMEVGDEVLFYHSSADPSGVAGVARISQIAEPDATALNKNHPYYDSKSTPEKPIWFAVEVEFKQKFLSLITLSQLRSTNGLEDLMVLKKGQRLSVQPLSENHYTRILKLAT